MEKRFLLTVVVCLIIFYVMFPSPARKPARPAGGGTPPTPSSGPPADTPGTGTAEPPLSPEAGSGDSGSAAGGAATTGLPASTATLGNGRLRVELTSLGAAISRVELLDYRDRDRESDLLLFGEVLHSEGALQLRIPGVPASQAGHWALRSERGANPARFELPLSDGRSIAKTYTLGGAEDPYLLQVQVEFAGDFSGTPQFALLGPDRIRFDSKREPNRFVFGLAGEGGFAGAERHSLGRVEGGVAPLEGPIAWAGLESTYFAFVLRPLGAGAAWSARREGASDDGPGRDASKLNANGVQAWPMRAVFTSVGESVPAEFRFEVFAGPKDRRLLARYEDRGYPELVYYGKLSVLVHLFLFLLGMFHSWTGSFGIAIIFLTVIVKIALHPLNKRNQGMMQRQQKKMAAIQPEMQKIKERYKNDALQANREIQKLMKEKNVNPAQMLGGCLLMFLQLPIWIGLISTFGLAIELRQETFLYISDLTQPDRLFPLPIPIVESFNLLPILYVILTLINQSMMPKASDPNMQQQQKMMKFMLVGFGVIFYNFSSGLLLYFLTSSGLGIIEQKIIRAELRREGLD